MLTLSSVSLLEIDRRGLYAKCHATSVLGTAERSKGGDTLAPILTFRRRARMGATLQARRCGRSHKQERRKTTRRFTSARIVFSDPPFHRSRRRGSVEGSTGSSHNPPTLASAMLGDGGDVHGHVTRAHMRPSGSSSKSSHRFASHTYEERRSTLSVPQRFAWVRLSTFPCSLDGPGSTCGSLLRVWLFGWRLGRRFSPASTMAGVWLGG